MVTACNLLSLSRLRTSVPPQPSYGSCSPTHGKVNKLPSVSQLMNPQQRNTLTPSSMSGGLTDSKCAPVFSLSVYLRPCTHPPTHPSCPVPPGLIVYLSRQHVRAGRRGPEHLSAPPPPSPWQKASSLKRMWSLWDSPAGPVWCIMCHPSPCVSVDIT